MRGRRHLERVPTRPLGLAATDALAGLGRVEQLVLRGDGLTTTSLEILTGDRIDVVVDGHWQMTVPPSRGGLLPGGTLHFDQEGPDVDGYLALAVNDLGASAGDAVLVREVLLVGVAGRVHGAAEVVAIRRQLPDAVVAALAATSAPIGRLLRDHGVPVVRELSRWGFVRAGSRAGRLGDGLLPGSRVLGRTYQMRHATTGEPVAVLTERFCPHVFSADPVDGGSGS